MKEAEFENWLVGTASGMGYLVVHFRAAMQKDGSWSTPMKGDTGFVDLVIAKPGVQFFAELKVGKEKPREDQQLWGQAFGEDYRLWYPQDIPQIVSELRDRSASNPSVRSAEFEKHLRDYRQRRQSDRVRALHKKASARKDLARRTKNPAT